MDDTTVIGALRRLAQIGVKGRLILAGSAAAILSEWVSRTTEDVDVIAATPKLSQIRKAIAQVAEELDLPEDWLNDAAVAWRDYLPPGFLQRTERIGRFEDLEVLRISRQDFILLKLIAFRPQDLEDLRELKPTATELQHCRQYLSRIAKWDGAAALRVELYLKQGTDQSNE
ncbi:DUF6036 family nucleotidyltransferase [Gemmatimonadota bacterium]